MTKMCKGKWIWFEDALGIQPEQGWFLRDIWLDAPPSRCVIQVCADSRYNLYINGRIVLRGPCRSRARFRCFDEIDIAAHLCRGQNRLFAEILHYSGDIKSSNQFVAGPASVESTMRGGFILHEVETDLGIKTDASWRCAYNAGYQFLPWAGYMPYMEKRDFRRQPEIPPFAADAGGWKAACEIYDGEPFVGGGLSALWDLRPRPIPFPFEKTCRFRQIDVIEPSGKRRPLDGQWVAADSELLLECDPGEYTTAFPVLSVKGGAGARIRLHYTEKFQLAAGGEAMYTDSVFDEYLTDGQTFILSPFYYRAFRKLGVQIKTAGAPILLESIAYRETGYPLSADTEFHAQEGVWNALWEISVRTLRRCMYETYMDCPYYEQMQYLMDTMLQMSYTYQLSGDDRMARKAIDDFAAAQLENGLLPCHAPARIIQLIPGFNAYFFLMLAEHYRHFGDDAFIRRYLPTAKRVYHFFMNKVAPDGLIKHTGYWQFVDWVEGWTHACPTEDGENYIYSMLFSYGFREMAWLCEMLHSEEAAEYRAASDALNRAVNQWGYDEKAGLYRDGRAAKGYSQHAQLWAVLCGAAGDRQEKELMIKALEDPRVVHKCSFCMTYFLFRALEKSGCYALSEPLWAPWIAAALGGTTTWAEDPISGRSMCHAWSALPLYEFIACGLGIQPLKPGYEEVLIEPKMLWLHSCEGKLRTPRGDIQVYLTALDGRFLLNVLLPCPTYTEVVLPNGSRAVYEAAEKIDVVWEMDVRLCG